MKRMRAIWNEDRQRKESKAQQKISRRENAAKNYKKLSALDHKVEPALCVSLIDGRGVSF